MDPVAMGEDTVFALQLLNYEADFCSERGLRPLSRCYFGTNVNQSEQFMYFVQLTQWLLEQCGSGSSGWNQYDDPGTVTNNIVIDLKNLGIVLNFPATKLKSGSGDAVVQALYELAQLALQNKRFQFRRPVIPEDDEEEGQGDDEDDMEGNMDELINQELSDEEDVAEFIEEIPDDMPMVKEEDREMIEAEVDPDEWIRECQRVAPKLKMGKIHDVNEWRSHLDQTQKFADTVRNSLPDVRSKLERVSDEVTQALDRISKKEAMLNRAMTGMTGDYKSTVVNFKTINDEHQTTKTHVEEMEN